MRETGIESLTFWISVQPALSPKPQHMHVYTFYRPIWKAPLLYSAVDGVRVCCIPAGLVWKMPQVHLMKNKIFMDCAYNHCNRMCFQTGSNSVCVRACMCGLVHVSWSQQRLRPPRHQWERKAPYLPSCPTRPEHAPARPQDLKTWTPLCPCWRSTAGHCTGWTWTWGR